MKYLFILIFFLAYEASYSQLDICYPYGANSCENAKTLCGNEHYEFCDNCPTFVTQQGNYFFSVIYYTFEVTDVNQVIDVQIGGSWLQSYLYLLGPVQPRCDTLYPVNPNELVSITAYPAQVNNQSLPYIGKYILVFLGVGNVSGDICPFLDINFTPNNLCVVEPCETCIGSFAPIPNGDYLIGTWVKEENASPTKTSYTYPELSVVCQTSAGQTTFGPFQAQGEIIDGWQRIEEQIHIPIDATNIQIVLASTSGNVFYDDVRMFPFDASMKSYVYDPVNMRLSAELDERHYATFYEYDEEGKLVRIKKETEKGVMTIQETKSNSSK